MSNFKDITGMRFGRLVAMYPMEKRSGSFVVWRCRCACGKAKEINGNNLRRGLVRSCGCLAAEGHVRHGHARRGKHTRAYDCWVGMRSRCRNPNKKSYPDYGGRGIDYCERWELFENFLADMGLPPAGMTLDRIDVNGNYEPGNCRWATAKQQRLNQRGTAIPISADEAFDAGRWSRKRAPAEALSCKPAS